MMIKYRVHDVAKDLDVPNKEVLDILGKYVKEPKKHMTALEENELDIVFDRFTQDHAAQNFDAYFATRNAAKTEEKPAEKTAEKPSEKTAKNTQEPKKQNVNSNNNRNKNNDRRNNNGNNRNQNAQQNKPQRSAQNNQPSNNTPAQESASEAPRRRVVDTRTVNVNIDKYNEKYDRLAYDKVKNDTVAAKQKINQKSQRRGKPRSAKRETEAERLNRIAAERKAKAITITVPDEITVGEFALRLKATSAEVIKKLMANGVFATINDTIDFDTAVLIADEFHAKVEKEVVVTIEDRIIDDSEDDDANLVRSSLSWATLTTARPPFWTPSATQTLPRAKPAASRSTSAHTASISTARTLRSLIRRVTPPSPPCVQEAPWLRISPCWSSQLMTASCRRR